MKLFGIELWRSYNTPLSHFTDECVKKYQKACNQGTDSEFEARVKLMRVNDLGRKVYVFKDSSQHYLIQYFNMVLEVRDYIGVNIYRDVFNEKYIPGYDLYVKWNREHWLESKREW